MASGRVRACDMPCDPLGRSGKPEQVVSRRGAYSAATGTERPPSKGSQGLYADARCWLVSDCRLSIERMAKGCPTRSATAETFGE